MECSCGTIIPTTGNLQAMNDAARDAEHFDTALWDALYLFEQLNDPLVQKVQRVVVWTPT